MKTNLAFLTEHYKSKSFGSTKSVTDHIDELYQKYIKEKEKSLIDAAATAVGIGSIIYSDNIDYDKIDGQMEEAFNLAFPGKSIQSISNYDTEQLQGIVSAWKGKYFEVLVRDKLNAGEYVGEIHLDYDQIAKIADSPLQEGWDLQILNGDGTIAEDLQLKATESLSYVKGALEKYPDIDVMTTEEVAGGVEGLLNSGMKDVDLEKSVSEPLEDLMDSTMENLVEDFMPILPFLIIVGREGQKVLVGKQSLVHGLQMTMKTSGKTVVVMFAVKIVSMINGDFLSVPIGLAARYLMGQYETSEEIKKFFVGESQNISPLLKLYGS